MPHSDPDRRQQYNREYKRANRFRYRERQKHYDAAKHANERSAQHGRPGIITPEDAADVLAAGACVYCGSPDRLTLDHRIGLHDPASVNSRDNLVAACFSCNAKKRQGSDPQQWASHFQRCRVCATTDRPHAGRGLCQRCWHREYRANRAASRP